MRLQHPDNDLRKKAANPGKLGRDCDTKNKRASLVSGLRAARTGWMNRAAAGIHINEKRVISRMTEKRRRLDMSKLVTVPPSEWRSFFDRLSKGLLGKWVEIEVSSLDLGNQVTAEWIPMFGITYDSRDDLLDVALDRIDHLIRHPKEIVVEEGPTGVTSVAVVDGEGVRQVVRMKEPLMLSAAGMQEPRTSDTSEREVTGSSRRGR